MWCSLAVGVALPLLLLRGMERRGRAAFAANVEVERRRRREGQEPSADLPEQLPAPEGKRGAVWQQDYAMQRWREVPVVQLAGHVVDVHLAVTACWLLALLLCDKNVKIQ